MASRAVLTARTPGAPDHLVGVRGVGIAVALAGVGALLVALAPVLAVGRAADGSAVGPGVAVAVLAALAVLAVPVLSVVLLWEGRLAGACGVLVGAAAIAVGAAVADVQLVVRGIDANRLELIRPTTAAPLSPGPGTWVVIAGHVLLLAAGVVAVVAVRRSGVLEDPDAPGGDGRAAGEGTLAGRAGRSVAVALIGSAVVLAAAQLAPALRSTDPVVLVPAPVDGPAALLVGSVLVSVAVLVVAVVAAVSSSVATASGAVAGAGLAALAIAAPRWAAGALGSSLSVGWGAVLATLAAVALVATGACAPLAARRDRGGPVTATRDSSSGPALPSVTRLTRYSGGLAALGGLLAVVGALAPVFTVPADVSAPAVSSARVVLLAGVLLAAAGAAVLAGGIGGTSVGLAADLRPVVGVLWAALVLGAGALGQAVLVGLAAPGVGAGAGAWLVLAATVLAVGAGVCAGLAGGLERDEVDTSDVPELGGGSAVLAGMVSLGAVLLVVLPLWSTSGTSAARAPALSHGGFGIDLWGLLVAAAAVTVVAWAAARSRPSRARAALVGALGVASVELAAWPLGAGEIGSAGPGPGLVGLALVLVGLVGLVVLAGRRTPVAASSQGRRPTRSRA